MKKAFVFPGQGAQFVGMGKDLYENSPEAKELFEKANEILGFRITDLMFEGTDEDLKQTKVTQPAIFLHSVILAKSLNEKPDMVAGHSLGEFSALVANGTLSFEDGLRLVHARALAMQKACEANPSTMAAILGLPDETVENILAEIDDVVAVSYTHLTLPTTNRYFRNDTRNCHRLRKIKSSRGQTGSPVKSRGCFPLSADGTCPERTGRCHHEHPFLTTFMPGLPERERTTSV